MGTTQSRTKGNKKTKTSSSGGGSHRRLFSFGACFGLSSPKKQHRKNLYHGPVRSAAAAHDHGDAVESLKYKSKKPKFVKSDIPTSESIKEIQIVPVTAVAAEAPPLLVHQVNNKTRVDQDVTTEEKKNRQELCIPAEISSKQTMIKLRHPASLPARPAPPQPRLEKGKTAAAAIGEGGNRDEMSALASGKFDSMVGASMITLTLVVMLIWGKVCAILCSAAWILFVHCFRQNNESFEHKRSVSDHHRIILDLDSHEYKKKVVLQGFLDRI